MWPEEEWDAFSDLIKDKVFELSGPNNSIATKVGHDQPGYWENCMVVWRVMGTGTGKHTISMKQLGSADFDPIMCGVVRVGAPCNEDHAQKESTVGWFMASDNGGLYGNGKDGADMAGNIIPGRVLTMQVDTDAGTLKFWVDGKPHGPGYTSGVMGESLRWATSVGCKGNTVEIVPTPELE